MLFEDTSRAAFLNRPTLDTPHVPSIGWVFYREPAPDTTGRIFDFIFIFISISISISSGTRRPGDGRNAETLAGDGTD